MSDAKRILVTGGAGFIGSNLVRHLLGDAEGNPNFTVAKVVTLDKLTYAGNPSNLESLKSDPRHVFVRGDILDGELVSRLLHEHDLNAVMHLAAESHVDRSIDGPEPFVMTNVVGTHRLLEASLRHHRERSASGRGDFRFLHVSTDEVYGSLGPEESAFSEAAPYRPNNPYSASKAGGDHLARAYQHTFGLPVVTTNCSNNYGPFQFPEKLVPLMILKAVRGEKLPVYGDGGNRRDWIYVGDHVRGLILALARGRVGETYHFGGNCEMRNTDVVRAIVDAVNLECPDLHRDAGELITFVEDRPGHDRRYAIDSAKAVSELGWRPSRTFSTGLRESVRWYLEHAPWVGEIESGNYRMERLGLG